MNFFIMFVMTVHLMNGQTVLERIYSKNPAACSALMSGYVPLVAAQDWVKDVKASCDLIRETEV